MRPLMSNSEWKAVLLLVPHDVGGVPSVDVSRWQRPSSPLQLVGCGLDPDQARPHLLKERQTIPALQLPTDNDVASRIGAMNLKDRLRKIETDRNDRFDAALPVNRDRPAAITSPATYVPLGEPSTALRADHMGNGVGIRRLAAYERQCLLMV